MAGVELVITSDIMLVNCSIFPTEVEIFILLLGPWFVIFTITMKLIILLPLQEFPYSEDTCYFSHCFPYTYSQLLSYLSRLEHDTLKSHYISRETLCYTVAGNCCPLLTITNFDGKQNVCAARSYVNVKTSTFLEPEQHSRMGIVITARVHPGETNSSWMMQGLIDFLISESDHAKVSHIMLFGIA